MKFHNRKINKLVFFGRCIVIVISLTLITKSAPAVYCAGDIYTEADGKRTFALYHKDTREYHTNIYDIHDIILDRPIPPDALSLEDKHARYPHCPERPIPTRNQPSLQPQIAAEPDTDTPQTCDGIAAPCHVWDFHTAPWAGLPVLPGYIENMYQLWEYLQAKTGRSRLNPITIQLLIGAYWKSYRGELDNELGEMRITPNTAINVINYSATIRFIGERVEGEEITLELPEGDTVEVYLIGFPQVPAKYKMHSDIAAIDGVDYVQRRLRGEDGRLRYVTVFDANDPNDAPIEAGQGIKIRIRKTLTLDLRGSVMAAPQAHRQHTLTTSWGAMKGVHRR